MLPNLPDSFKSQLDPRISLIFVTINFFGIAILTGLSSLLIMLVFHLALFIFLPKISIKKIIFPLLFVSIFFSLMNLLKILSTGELVIALLKFYNFSILFNWFYLGVTPRDLTIAFMWFKVPYTWAWTISSSFRFIEVFIEETKDIFTIQLLRGIPLDGNIFDRIKYLPSIILPLIFRVQVRSNQLAEALYIKGWNPNRKGKMYSKWDIKQKNNAFWISIYFSELFITFLSLF